MLSVNFGIKFETIIYLLSLCPKKLVATSFCFPQVVSFFHFPSIIFQKNKKISLPHNKKGFTASSFFSFSRQGSLLTCIYSNETPIPSHKIAIVSLEIAISQLSYQRNH
jgi:hypothetical protein